MSREILLLRHGMTAGNALKQYIGVTDQPLCPEGRAALEVCRRETADAVYVSPLLRCRQTAEILFPGARQIIVPGLREMNFGVFEARSYTDMENDPDYKAWLDSNCEAPIPGGEQKSGFSDRCCAAFEEILRTDGSPRLNFVVHGGTIMAVLAAYAAPKREYYRWGCGNGHGYRLRTVENGPYMELLEEI